MRTTVRVRGAAVAVAVAAVGAAVLVAPGSAGAAQQRGAVCGTTTNTEYATGTTAAAIGWAGNSQAVVACLSGSFVVVGTQQLYGYGVWNGSRTTWTRAEGHLPALTTAFGTDRAAVAITNFADEVTIGGHRYVAVYSRVAVTNPTGYAISVDPRPTPGLVPLDAPGNRVAPHSTVDHDYVVFSDEFGGGSAYPSAGQLAAAGSWDRHYAHMRAYWTAQLAQIAQLTSLPDPRLADAYASGFVDTQITRAGTALKTGVNGYDKEYSHDVVGILANLLTQGFRGEDGVSDVDLLLRLRDTVGTQAQYDDGIWKYSWPWAIYLQKTGDVASVRANFATPGPQGSALQPSIRDSAHAIAAARTGPGGIIQKTNDIDANGYWTIDDYSALMGLAAYRWLTGQLGDTAENHWADQQYTGLLDAVNQRLERTISANHLHYLPCSMVEPNDANRCSVPQDANWAAPFLFGRWAWDGYLFDAPTRGPGVDLIDATYDYGFGRLRGLLPPGTYGGYGDTEYSTGYNAGYGEWGLASQQHRDQGIVGYEFMIDRTQSGPDAWWESVAAPDPSSPWVGSHPSAGAGASPHAWGAADANLVLLASLVAERGDGSLVVGRGVPNSWIGHAPAISVGNVPVARGGRMGERITASGRTVTLTLTGTAPTGQILFQLPAFEHNLVSASSGTVDPATGTVTLAPGTRTVRVTMAHTVS